MAGNQAQFDVRVVLPIHAKLGEGALWCVERQRLYWVDIEGKKVYEYDPVTGKNRGWEMPSRVGTVVVKEREDQKLMVALEDGFAELDMGSGKVVPVVNGDPEAGMVDVGGGRINRFNDGKCDPAGRFWAGTINYKREPKANLWCLEVDGKISKKVEGVINSNGIVWNSRRDTMYYINTPTHQVWGFDYEMATGKVSNKRVVVAVDGHPDGMTIDCENKIWVAIWGGSRVVRFDPETGKVLVEVMVPGAKNITSCAFGGVDLDELYITTAGGSGEGMSWNEREHSGQEQAGNLFVVKLPWRGVKSVGYRG